MPALQLDKTKGMKGGRFTCVHTFKNCKKCRYMLVDMDYGRDFFLLSSGAEIRPLSKWEFGDFFPNLN